MLRVGLTGGLGSGKSTVAAMLARRGAYVLSADEIGRELMEPGRAVYDAIVTLFGAGVVRGDGSLDRSALARLAFGEGRVEELNGIVHPAVIAEQARLTEEIAAGDPKGIVVAESALILETKYGERRETGAAESRARVVTDEPWQRRFDWLVLVTASETAKIARFVARSAGGRALHTAGMAGFAEEARRRLARQMTDEQKAAAADYVLPNDGSIEELEQRVEALWAKLQTRVQRGERP